MSLYTVSPHAPAFEVLTEEGVQKTHAAVLKVLGEVGIDFPHAEALVIFERAGAIVGGDRVRLPGSLVMEALARAPECVTLYDRSGQAAMVVGGPHVHFGTYGTAPYAYDPYTGERSLATRKTIADAARICDALPHIEWAMPMGVPSDVPVPVADRHQFYQAVTNQGKPLYSSTYTAQGLVDVIEMASVIAGDREALTARPFFTTGINPSSPLRYSTDVIAKLLVMADAGLPIIYNSCPMAGGTAPGTMAGTVVIALAESLAGAVLAQLRRPGVPVIPGGGPATMDMLTTVCGQGAPELALMVAAYAQMSRFYKIPSYGTAGASNSKLVDPQTAVEFTNSILTSALARSNLVHCGGSIDTCMTVSLEAFVLLDEIIAMARRIAGGMEVSDETLGVEVIKQVGPGGHFLEQRHTLRHFREHHQSKLIDRQNFDGWVMSGSKSMNDRMTEKTHWILEHHQPAPLPEAVASRLAGMMARFER